MDTHDDIVDSQPASAGADRDAQRPDGAGGAEPSITAPHSDIPLEGKDLRPGVDSRSLSVQDSSGSDEYEREVLESCDPVRVRFAESDGDLPWLKEGDRVKLKRPSSPVGPKVGGCGTVLSERRKDDLRMIMIDWDEDAWSQGIQALRDEIVPGRRIVVFTVKTPLGEPLELVAAQGGTC